MIKRLFSKSMETVEPGRPLRKSKSLGTIAEDRSWMKTKLIYFLISMIIPDQDEIQKFLNRLFQIGVFEERDRRILSWNPSRPVTSTDIVVRSDEIIRFPFKKRRRIGRGSFGEVYHCFHLLDQKEYAVKTISSNDSDLQEVRILSSLCHPNIIRYFSSWTENGYLFLQMELCTRNVRDYLETTERNVSILHQIVNGLGYLHDQSYIHFDLKPENILLTETNQVKVCDFGYSRLSLMEKYKKEEYEGSLYLHKNDSIFHTSMDMYSFGMIVLEFFLPHCITFCEKIQYIKDGMVNPETYIKDPLFLHVFHHCTMEEQLQRMTCKDYQYLFANK